MNDRRYVLRNQELALFEFDPVKDIRISSNGCWEWQSKRPELQAWAVNYYRQRKEDGNGHSPNGTAGDARHEPKIPTCQFSNDQEYIAALEAALGRAHLEIDCLRQMLQVKATQT
jgi:hypothetical protein